MNGYKQTKYRLTQHLLESGAFDHSQMTVADVGVRGGFESHWSIYGNKIHLIGFDPDARECERLHHSANSLRLESYYPVALYRCKGTHTLYVSQNLSASSLLEPNPKFLDRFPQSVPGAMTTTAQIQTSDLDSFVEENQLGYVDFMKIDVEGAELALLEGAKRTLSQSLLGLSVEVYFQPYHIGEPLFADVDQYLRGFGFEFFDFLNMEKWSRKALATDDPRSWYGAGQIIWAQALYFRDLAAEMLSPGYAPDRNFRVKVLKLASLAELFGCPDFSAELLDNALRIGMLGEDDVAGMGRLLMPFEEATGAGGNHRRRSRLGLVKQSALSFLPVTYRKGLRRWLEAILSS